MAATGFRRLFQWRMRTLLVLMTLAGFGLMFWNSYVAIYLAQEEAQASLDEVAAQIGAEAATPEFLGSLIGEERYHKVVQCRLSGYNVDDEKIAPLVDLPYLKRLYLEKTSVGDEGAKIISQLRELERLSLWRTRVTDAALPYLARCKNLRVLDLHDTSITDDGLAALQPLKQLRHLKLGGPIHGPGLAVLAKMPSLRELNLKESSVGYDDLKHLEGSRIDRLHVDWQMPARVIKHLRTMPNLRDVNALIVEADDNDVAMLCECRNLESLRLTGVGVTDAAMKSIRKLKGLRQLHLHGDLTDATLEQIAEMKQLDEVQLHGRFHVDAIEELAKKRPALTGMIRGLVPTTYFRTRPAKVGGIDVQPLVAFTAGRWGRSAKNLIGDSQPLFAHLTWPATMEDLAELKGFEHRILEIMMTNPPSASRRHGEPAVWSIKSLHKFPILRNLRLARLPADEPIDLRSAEMLNELILLDGELADADIERLLLPKNLRSLFITPSRISPAGVKEIRKRFPQLSKVRENGQGSTTSHWQAMMTGQGTVDSMGQKRNLKTVLIEQIHEPLDLTPLAARGTVESIHINGQFQRVSMWRLDKPLPKLKELSIRGDTVTDATLAQLKHMPALERLRLRDSSISDLAFQHFVHVPELRTFAASSSSPVPNDPYGPWINGSGLKTLAKHCPRLEQLELQGSWLSDATAADLVQFESLKHLNLDSTKIGDETCRRLAEMPNLETLHLSSTRITDQGLMHLTAAPRLQTLTVYGTRVTPQGRQKFQELTPVRLRR